MALVPGRNSHWVLNTLQRNQTIRRCCPEACGAHTDCSRIISAQYGTGFTKSECGKIKAVDVPYGFAFLLPYISLKLHLAKCPRHPTPYYTPPYFVKALFCPVHHHANSAPLLWAPPSRGGSHRNPITARSRQAAESPPAPKAQRPRGPPA